MKLRTRLLLLALGLSLSAWGWAGPGWLRAWRTAAAPLAANIVVNATADGTLAALNGNGTCDLREAIQAANTNAIVGQCPAGMTGLDTISFSVMGTITLTAGELAISEAVTINGPGASLLTISGNNASRVFNIAAGNFNLTLTGLTIANGQVGSADARGGGILNNSTGTLTISNSTLMGNKAAGNGGSGNLGRGGGIFSSTTGTINVTNSTFAGNMATATGGGGTTGFGGGIYNENGTVNISASTFAGNMATGTSGSNGNEGRGGGIANAANSVLNVVNSTLSGNSATGGNASSSILGLGGGIHNTGAMNLINSTLTGNSAVALGGAAIQRASEGGGLFGISSATVNVRNTIIARNSAEAGPDLFAPGMNISQGYNLIGDGTASNFVNGVNNDQVGSMATPLDPQLGSLQNNGGPTQTHLPLTGSPAIDKGAAATNPITSAAITSDQRGLLRPQDSPAVANAPGGNGSDVGAVEVEVPLPPAISKTFGAPAIALGATTSLTFTITNPNPSTALTGLGFTDTLPAGLIVAPGIGGTCNGTVTAITGSNTISYSGGVLTGGMSCTITVKVRGILPGAQTNSVTATSNEGGAGNTATATVTVGNAPLSVTIADPFGCTGPGDLLTVTVTTSNPTPIAQTVSFMATLPANLAGVPGSGTASAGAPPTVTATSATYTATLAPGQAVTVTYQVQVGDAASGAQLCIVTALTFGGAPSGSVTACATVDCPPVGPGLPFPANAEVSDQKAGSVLVYNLYSSSAASPNTQNTRLSITNVNPALAIAVHLFFVDGATCSIADAIICLTKNQTASFLASDLDPGTTGYLVAVASDLANGCPVNFNFLIGDEYVKLASGHAANLGAEAFAALAGGPVACDGNAVTVTLNFDGVSYNRVPRTLAASSIPARADGNDTLLVVNRFGGNLAVGAGTLFNLFGIFYDDAETGLSFTFSPGVCQFRSSLSNNFPRLTPRFENFIPAGRSGWLRLYSTSDLGLLGALLNYNPNAGTAAGAFNQGRNLHKLTLTPTQTLIIPIFPPNCLD